MGFPRQEYWNGLPFPFPGNLPNPEIQPKSAVFQVDYFITEPPEEPLVSYYCVTSYCKLSGLENSQLLSQNFFGLGVQVHISWIRCSGNHQAEIKILAKELILICGSGSF